MHLHNHGVAPSILLIVQIESQPLVALNYSSLLTCAFHGLGHNSFPPKISHHFLFLFIFRSRQSYCLSQHFKIVKELQQIGEL